MSVASERRKQESQGAVLLEEPRQVCWTRAQFHRMADLGILPSDTRVELIEGEILEMSPMNPPHAVGVSLVRDRLREVFGQGFYVMSQLPLAFTDITETYPDVAVATGAAEDYVAEHPQEAVLVVEVSDTTLKSDRTRKASLYARAGVADYWIADLVNRTIEVRRDPGPVPGAIFGHDYRSLTIHPVGGSVSPLAAPGVALAVADLLPPVPRER